MLVLKKEMAFYEFMDEFSYELKEIQGLTNEGAEIVFDSLCDMMAAGIDTAMQVSDYIRYQLRVSSLDDVIDAYGYVMDLDGLKGDALVAAVEDGLSYNTYLLGTYKKDGELFFIFDEF